MVLELKVYLPVQLTKLTSPSECLYVVMPNALWLPAVAVTMRVGSSFLANDLPNP